MNKIILYGAGNIGRAYYHFLKKKGFGDLVIGFCDRNSSQIGKIENVPCLSFEEAKKEIVSGVVFVVSCNKYHEEICKVLEENNVRFYDNLNEYTLSNLEVDHVQWNREYCSYFHIHDMDSYFASHESVFFMNIFWAEDSIFYRLFQKLNLESVVELACGRGRHVERYIDRADKIVLVDILQGNIDFCKERYEGKKNVEYYVNNGYDLAELQSDSYTGIFSYDAMVHFELMDIANYLMESYRILKKGGRGLFHHSNNHSDPRVSFDSFGNSDGRSFMSKEIFAHLAYRAGFKVLEQHVIDWSGVSGLDCVTLLEK